MKTPLEKSLSLALTYSSGEQYKLNVARFAPPKILSAGTPNCRDLQAAALPPYHYEGIALVSRVVKMIATRVGGALFRL